MIGSRACEYGIQTLVYLEEHAEPGFTSVPEIAQGCDLSPSFLSKVVLQLVDAGLLVSQRGPGGGVCLGRHAKDIRLIDVVEAIDGVGFNERCVIGYPGCKDSAPCPLHDTWGPIREQIARMLSERSLRQLVSEMHDDPAHRADQSAGKTSPTKVTRKHSQSKGRV